MERKQNYMRKYLLFIAMLCNILVANAQDFTVEYGYNKISKDDRSDSTLIKMLLPYKDSLNKSMNRVIGFATNTMYKKQPESALGNLLADCVKGMAEKKYGKKVDVGMVNFGGVRSYISKGDVTVGKVYELMPFDNLLVIQSLKGDTLLMLLNRIAEKGGWPISGITMQIKEGKSLNVMVNGKVLDLDAYYIVANSDYIANGGDDCNMLRGVPQLNGGYLLRDVIIDYISTITEQGNPIEAKIEKRITYAN